MTKEKIKGHAAMLLTAIIFGVNIPITKSLMPNWIDSFGLSYSRMLFGCAAFWITSLFLPYEKVPAKDMVVMFFAGIFGVIINQMSFVVGLGYTAPIDSSIVITITPVLVMILSAIFLKEPISLLKTAGIIVGASGALLIIFSNAPMAIVATNRMLGNTLCFISSLSYAIYLIFTKSIIARYHPVTLMKWLFLFSAILSVPIGLDKVISSPIFTGEADYTVWLRFGFVLVCATFLTYLLMPIALKQIRPTTVSMYNYVQPLVASIVAIYIGQDLLSWQKPIAGILVFAGVWMVTKSKSRADIEKNERPEPKQPEQPK